MTEHVSAVRHASAQELEDRKKEVVELKTLLADAKKSAGTAQGTAKKAEDELKQARCRNLSCK